MPHGKYLRIRTQERKCLNCGEDFLALRSNHLFCKTQCQKAYWFQKSPQQYEKKRKACRIWREKRRTQLRKIFGLKCRICKRKVKRIELHEIHGKPHIHTPNVYLKSPQDFIPLCRQCHATISWIMKYLKEFNLFFEEFL